MAGLLTAAAMSVAGTVRGGRYRSGSAWAECHSASLIAFFSCLLDCHLHSSGSDEHFIEMPNVLNPTSRSQMGLGNCPGWHI